MIVASATLARMTQPRTLELFQIACNATSRAVGIEDAEPDMARFISHAGSQPDERSAVADLLRNGLTDGTCPWEFSAYCFHALRWSELLDAVEALRPAWTNDPRKQNIWAHLHDAFEDDWEDLDMFPTLRR
jgi:hypothetical protein